MKIRNISEALLPRPKVHYYIDKIIRPASMNMFWAAPGTGKSLAFITMGICFASSEINNWMGFDIQEKGKVLFIQEEMGDDGFLEFLEETYRGFFGGKKKNIPFDFGVYTGLDFSNDASVKKLAVIIEKENYNMIFTDSFAATISDDENAKKDMQPALERVKTLMSLPSKPAVIFTHHPTRDRTRFRGSGAIDAALDLLVEIKGAKDNNLEFRMEKNRYKPCIEWTAKKVFEKDEKGNDVFRLERTGKLSDLEEGQKVMITIIENNPTIGQDEISNMFISMGGKKSHVGTILKMLDDSEVTEVYTDSIGGRGKKKMRRLTSAYIAERMTENLVEITTPKFSKNGH